MKKFLLFLLLLCPVLAFAQKNGDVIDVDPAYPLNVRPAPAMWGGEGLEVTTTFGGLLWKPMSGIPVQQGCIITEVNGQTTKGMTPAEFYQAIDRDDAISLKWFFSTNTENIFIYERIKYKGRFPVIKGLWLNYEPGDNTIRFYRDQDINFRNYKTFDYLIADPKEKDIAQQFMDGIARSALKLKRDTENPDLLIKVSFSEDRNVSSTYIPPSTRTENLGSTTTQRYSYLTNQVYYETQNQTRTVKEGGYTQTTVTNQLYLEIAFLDTKMMNDPNRKVAPVVWSLTYKYVVEGKKDIFTQATELIQKYGSKFPYNSREYLCHLYLSGLCLDEDGNLVDVIPGSRADKAGLKIGDEFIKNQGIHYNGYGKNWSEFTKDVYTAWVQNLTLKRGKQKLTLDNIFLFENPYAPNYVLIPALVTP